jgi:hypothetical protein
MAQKYSVAQIFLWLLVIILGLEIGAGLYETLVVLPIWSAAPPDSVLSYHQHNIAYPQFALNAGARFWIFFTPLAGLLALGTILSGLKTRPEHRKWRLTGATLAIAVVVFTFAWFVPNLMVLRSGDAGLSPEQLTSLTNWWVGLNWVRVVVYSSGWLATLRATTIPAW